MKYWCTRSLSDDTYCYDFRLQNEKTVEDVIEWILENKLGEWGDISVNADNRSVYHHTAKCEYTNHSIKGDPIPDEYLTREVKEMTANGGWGRMDFVIFI